MTTPKVSVVMSVYNGEKYLREAVDSILNQTFRDFEFIIIDDGSTDSTPEILRSYEDPRIVLLRNEQNIGLTKSLNRELAVAQGEYIARMDADDVSLPERLEKQANFLEGHPQVALVGTAFAGIDERGQVRWEWQEALTDLEIKWQLLIENAFGHSTTMFRRDAAAAVGNYPEERVVCQDYALWSLMARRFSLANLPEILVYRRDDGSGVSYERQEEHATQRWDIALHNQRYLAPDVHNGLDPHRILPALWGLWFIRPEIIKVAHARVACELAWRLRRAFVHRYFATQAEQYHAARWCRDWLFQRLTPLIWHFLGDHQIEVAQSIVEDAMKEISDGPPIEKKQ